jgi:hypothetical protein
MTPTVTAREFYGSLTTVWLFVAILAIQNAREADRWVDYVLPIGTLAMLAIHAAAWRRHERRSDG